MLEFLGFLAIISIIFGISMGQAFGGLVSFVVWFIAILVVIYFFISLGEKISDYNSPESKKIRERKLEEQKELAKKQLEKRSEPIIVDTKPNKAGIVFLVSISVCIVALIAWVVFLAVTGSF